MVVHIMVQYLCGRCSMLLQSLLLAAYGNTRKEEVASVRVFSITKMQSLRCVKLLTRFPTEVQIYKLQETQDCICVWDINATCAKRIHRGIGEMINLDSQPFSVVLNIDKSNRY